MVSRSKGKSRSTHGSTPRKVLLSWPPHRAWWLVIAAILSTLFFLYWMLESPSSYYRKASQLLVTDPEQCEKLAEISIARAGGDYPKAQLLQCQALGALGEWEASLGGFSLIRNTATCSADALLALGENAFAAGKYQLAEKCLRAAQRPGATVPRATELLVRLALIRRDLQEGIELCREWQNAAPDSALAWSTSGDIKVTKFDLAEAISDFQEALRRPQSSELEQSTRSSLANLLVHTGDIAAARQQFDRLLVLGPLHGKAHLDFIQLLRMEGELTQALQEANRFISENARNPEGHKWRGIIQFDRENLEDALTDLKSAVEGNRFDIGSHNFLAQIYQRRGDEKLSQQHFEISRRMTDATFRISELNRLLESDPSNNTLLRELRELKSVLGQ